MFVCPALHFAVLQRIELKLGWVVGMDPTHTHTHTHTLLWSSFRSDPTKSQGSSRGHVALEIGCGHQLW